MKKNIGQKLALYPTPAIVRVATASMIASLSFVVVIVVLYELGASSGSGSMTSPAIVFGSERRCLHACHIVHRTRNGCLDAHTLPKSYPSLTQGVPKV